MEGQSALSSQQQSLKTFDSSISSNHMNNVVNHVSSIIDQFLAKTTNPHCVHF